MTEDMTPPHLRCVSGSCPAVYRLDDGRLLIVGENYAVHDDKDWMVDLPVGEDEWAVIISPDLLSSYVQEEVKKATERLRKALIDIRDVEGPGLEAIEDVKAIARAALGEPDARHIEEGNDDPVVSCTFCGGGDFFEDPNGVERCSYCKRNTDECHCVGCRSSR